MGEVQGIVLNFFKSLKCSVEDKGTYFVLKDIPEKIEKYFGFKSPAKIYFSKENYSGEGYFIDENSEIIKKIKDYLKNSSSKTLLRIDFDFPNNIKDKIRLRNCTLSKIEKKQENNYFSRFTFLTSFRSLNKTEQISTEIFVHEGKIVHGDLSDYNVHEGDVKEASTEHLEKDYGFAREYLKGLLKEKTKEFSSSLNEKLKKEIDRIDVHYNQVFKEFDTNRKKLLERINEAEISQDSEKLKRLKDTFALSFSDKEEKKIKDERDVVVGNEQSKYSLDIDNKLINTTIIYYPIFKIQVTLSESGFTKNFELIYNPLTDDLTQAQCDSCGTTLDQINVCRGGHICCSSCLHMCNECGKRYCHNCFSGVCDNCGKLVCKNCARKCNSCGKLSCKGCTRVSNSSGRELCQSCVSYCPVCSKVTEKKQMVRGSDGKMVCHDCSRKKR